MSTTEDEKSLRNLVLNYGLSSINPSLARIGDPIIGLDGEINIDVIILPCEDLTINTEVVLEYSISSNFKTNGGLKITTTTPKCFPSEVITSKNEISLAWIDQAKKYPLSVWFFAIRNLLRRADESPWITPILIRNEIIATDSVDDFVSIIAGAGRTRGRRPYMEDVDIAFDSVRITDRLCVSIYGVLDGHGGQECARFSADEIPTKLITGLRTGKSFPETLFQSFLETDQDYLKGQKGSAGSTANILLFDPTQSVIYIANAGDTRSVLCRGQRAINLSDDKKATNAAEIARVAESGGYVVNGRVMGSLAVARALGDSYLKNTDNGGVKRAVIPDPEITAFRTQVDDEFIIVASDGLWDVMPSQAAVDMVKEHLDKYIPSDMMSNHASRILGSADNVTVQILLFRRTAADVARRMSFSAKGNARFEMRGISTMSNDYDSTSYGSRSPRSPRAAVDGTGVTKTQSQSRSSTPRASSLASATVTATVVAESPQTADKKAKVADDDLMNFLMDDNNF
eukprot:gene1380-2657_t